MDVTSRRPFWARAEWCGAVISFVAPALILLFERRSGLSWWYTFEHYHLASLKVIFTIIFVINLLTIIVLLKRREMNVYLSVAWLLAILGLLGTLVYLHYLFFPAYVTAF